MRAVFKYIVRTLLLIIFVASVFIWFEAEKEIRILCSMFSHGQESEVVIKTLDTGNFLEYRLEKSGDETLLFVESPYNLWSSRCTLQISEDSLVTESRYVNLFNLEKTAAWIGGLFCLGIAFLQLMSILGIPLGRLVCAGESHTLSAKSYISAFLSVLILLFGMAVLFESAGISSLFGNQLIISYSVPSLAVFFGLSSLFNLLQLSVVGKKVTSRASLLLFLMFAIAVMAG